MPYLHWETDRGRMRTANKIKEVNKQQFSTVADIVNQTNKPDSGSDPLLAPHQTDARPEIRFAGQGERRRQLGEVLRRAAQLLEAIEFETEEGLLNEYLHSRRPLHPRRTLDQSYYGALKNTGTRDRDQVVYRATAPVVHACYDHFDEATGKCRQCAEDSRKTARLIMVDQLWLWILDERESSITSLGSCIEILVFACC